jgi:hypothetical protein
MDEMRDECFHKKLWVGYARAGAGKAAVLELLCLSKTNLYQNSGFLANCPVFSANAQKYICIEVFKKYTCFANKPVPLHIFLKLTVH